ncbi:MULTISPECIES: nucleoside hydrolase [unclassified Novosphingobium]|uniref:nucleoside hydrolase n=1 Tax=unclassified Novosphingobium TaxID=2644732 RepID=UPI001853339A|nr:MULTISPECIES: nucleoside hydrolase [unclassified Novosphingobium]NMN05779.1 inosine-uridine nucleoside N-ribohydrolase [Novosphingobium sp. SG919]NMN87861.1 inosine-uridine nucleoside N-ribohydrolase [Novosphingobium sp. SG916]
MGLLRPLIGRRGAALLLGLCLALAGNAGAAQTPSFASPEKIIMDADFGIDDAMALILLARRPDVQLLGVTTVFGNAQIADTTRNALFLKDYLGFSAPIARGAAKPLIGPTPPPPAWIHGANGLGNYAMPAPHAALDPRSAPQLIIDVVRSHPGEVTILAVGRLTNLAAALAMAPDLLRLAKRVVIMGGAFGYNYQGARQGANPFTVAEANIGGDPEAADAVINAGWPVTLVPLDVTIRTVMDRAYLDALSGQDGALIRAITRQTYLSPQGTMPVHDSSAVFYALRPAAYVTVEGVVRVEPSGGPGAGVTLMEPPGSTDAGFAGHGAIKVATGVDVPAVLAFYAQTLREGGH